jgi:hypothetical protein
MYPVEKAVCSLLGERHGNLPTVIKGLWSFFGNEKPFPAKRGFVLETKQLTLAKFLLLKGDWW